MLSLKQSLIANITIGERAPARAILCEDAELIKGWFTLAQSTNAKYGITDADIYNFDETGFQMGIITLAIVVTNPKRRNRPKAIQPRNREWVTVVQGINAQGWSIPSFIIMKGQNHLLTWYDEDIPQDLHSKREWMDNK